MLSFIFSSLCVLDFSDFLCVGECNIRSCCSFRDESAWMEVVCKDDFYPYLHPHSFLVGKFDVTPIVSNEALS